MAARPVGPTDQAPRPIGTQRCRLRRQGPDPAQATGRWQYRVPIGGVNGSTRWSLTRVRKRLRRATGKRPIAGAEGGWLDSPERQTFCRIAHEPAAVTPSRMVWMKSKASAEVHPPSCSMTPPLARTVAILQNR